MTTNYEQGRETEYKAMRDLTAQGYEVVRMAGSHSALDVIAWREDGSKFVQCKSYTKRPMSYAEDIAKLEAIQLPPNSTAELWVRQKGKRGWVLQQVVKSTLPN